MLSSLSLECRYLSMGWTSCLEPHAVGTQQFMVQLDGQLSRITVKAARYIELIKQVGHSQAQYQLLCFTASTSLHHCP